MKIATWNIERLKHKSKIEEIQSIINHVDADILVLTEMDDRVELNNFPFQFKSEYFAKDNDVEFLPTEHRVAIFSKYEIIRNIDTWNNQSSICVELKTPENNLFVYGTIIGAQGNRTKSFHLELEAQILDIHRQSKLGSFCIVGDYNISFSDNYYFTNHGRDQLNQTFLQNNLRLITREISECIDHIAISDSFLKDKAMNISEWNLDKKLSDHKGIVVEIKDL